MNQRQHNPRYAADRDLIESLSQLKKTLQLADQQVVPPLPPSNAPSHDSPDAAADPFDLSSFEQAVADIESFMQAQQRQEGEG